MRRTKLGMLAAATVALATFSGLTAAAPAHAAIQKSACSDGAGHVWRAKANWGPRYRKADGTQRVRLTSVRWTTQTGTPRARVEIRTYQPDGRLLQTLADDPGPRHAAGVWSARNPADPLAGPGRAVVRITVGTRGAERCGIVFVAPSSATSASLSSVGAPVPAGSPVPLGAPGRWRQVFGDEFSGTAVDKDNWSDAYCKTMNKTLIAPANTTVANGVATLRLAGGKGAMLTSASVDGCPVATRGFALPVGGYTEARVRLPATSTGACANWPAWWTAGPDWPAAGEHDIAEVLDGTATGNYHSPTVALRTRTGPASKLCGSWHVYGLYRGARSSDLYWDGYKVASYATSDNGGPQSLILNIGLHSANTDLTQTLRVDYVRAWSPA